MPACKVPLIKTILLPRDCKSKLLINLFHFLFYSRLLATLLPDGHQYEWTLRGTCTKPATQPEKALLLCNKLLLNWPGVALLNTKQQRIILKNNSDRPIDLSMSITDSHPSYRIVCNNTPTLIERASNRYEATVKPNGEFPVYISYSPTSLAMEKSSLTLRAVNGSTKYVIPLAGYGGTSNLDIRGPKLVNGEFVLDMGHSSLGQKKTMSLMIRNSGLRASFVALKCFSGMISYFL